MDINRWDYVGHLDTGLGVSRLFTNAANGDFTLQGGSPALNAGRDVLNLKGGGTSAIINMGAYITAGQTDQIGPRV